MSSSPLRPPAPQEAAPLPQASQSPQHDDVGFDIPAPLRLGRMRIGAFVVLSFAVAATAFFVGYLPRRHAREALREAAKAREATSTRVEVVTPSVVASDHALLMPATVEPLEETRILPRASGYVRSWSVDLGDKVEAGQVLAEIDTPEIDQEVAQARADLARTAAAITQAKASADLAHTNVDRAEKLVSGGVSSQQDLDQRKGEARVADANVHAAEANASSAAANVHRLEDLKAFAKIVAPFAGTVTERSIQRGDLVTPGQATPLFKIAILDPMRVVVAVPQDVAPSVAPNVEADLSVREFPGVKFAGKVSRSARALDLATRTMTTEVRVANPDGKLLSGMFAQVSLTLPSPHQVLEIPATALYSDGKGQRVATIDADDRVHYANVLVERDTGATVLVATGLEPTARVVKLADVSLVEGALVDVAK